MNLEFSAWAIAPSLPKLTSAPESNSILITWSWFVKLDLVGVFYVLSLILKVPTKFPLKNSNHEISYLSTMVLKKMQFLVQHLFLFKSNTQQFNVYITNIKKALNVIFRYISYFESALKYSLRSSQFEIYIRYTFSSFEISSI